MNKRELKNIICAFIPYELMLLHDLGYKLSKDQFDNLDFESSDTCLYGQLFDELNEDQLKDIKSRVATFPVGIRELNIYTKTVDNLSSTLTAFEIFSFHFPTKAKELLVEYGLVEDVQDDTQIVWE